MQDVQPSTIIRQGETTTMVHVRPCAMPNLLLTVNGAGARTIGIQKLQIHDRSTLLLVLAGLGTFK